METLFYAPSFLLGLIGWAATVKLILDMPELAPIKQHVMIVFTWLLWMVPAFDVLVYQGMITSDTAVSYGGAMTVLPALFVSITSIRS